ncbi:MAG: permease-like cell division protein FtsX, partial [Oscillospiraceae bacterium]|nr:permease-like cell division protein FtsX [Oscillospiraceae bacterium]
LAVNIRDLFTSIENQNEVVLFIKDDATAQQVEALGDLVEQMDHVLDYHFVSKEQALAEQKEFMGDQGYLLDGLEDDNPLPASYRITLDGLEHIDAVLAELDGRAGIDSVSAPTDLAHTLTGIEKTMLILGSIIIGILIVASTVVISNTIRLTLFARRREINIMKYVGATDSFIRLPYVVEGMTIGFISAVISFFVIFGIYGSLGSMLSGSSISWLTGMSSQLIPFAQLWYWVLGAFLLFGMAIGALGSAISIRRYLRV